MKAGKTGSPLRKKQEILSKERPKDPYQSSKIIKLWRGSFGLSFRTCHYFLRRGLPVFLASDIVYS
jgi:hypothetical protein